MRNKIALITTCLTGLLSMNSHAAESVDVTFNVSVLAGTCSVTASDVDLGSVNVTTTPTNWVPVGSTGMLSVGLDCTGALGNSGTPALKFSLPTDTKVLASSSNKVFRTAASAAGWGIGIYNKEVPTAADKTTNTNLITADGVVNIGAAGASYASLSKTYKYAVALLCGSTCSATLGTGAVSAKMTITFQYK